MATCATIFLSVDIYFYMVSTNWLISFIKDIVDSMHHTNLECSQTRNFPMFIFQQELDVTVNVYSLKKELPNTYLQGNTDPPAIISQGIISPDCRFFVVNRYSFGK